MGLGSGIRKKPIPDPQSRIQESKRHRIQDPDPQHCCTDFCFALFGTIRSLCAVHAASQDYLL
jgi:hypothetical protein